MCVCRMSAEGLFVITLRMLKRGWWGGGRGEEEEDMNERNGALHVGSVVVIEM